jgi:hypothetical protein
MASKIVKMKQMLCLLCALLSLNAGAQVTFNGIKPAVDNLTGNWLLSVPKSVYGKPYQVSLTFDDNVTSCIINGVNVKETGQYTFPIINPGSSYSIQMVMDTYAVNAAIQFTYWPVIQIYSENEGDFVKRPYEGGSVTVTIPDSSSQETIKSRVRWAGSSTAEPDREKHNFHLKFYNEDGTKKNMSFFGLRKDFHWRLDAGQIDFSRVRNRVCKDIWAAFSTPPYYASIEPKTVRNYVRGDFVEVFLNDKYMGIYCLNEHMDRQQLKLKQYDYENNVFHGGLWKPMKWTNTTLFDNLPGLNARRKYWDEFYVKYPNIDDVSPTNFKTLYQAVKFAKKSSDQEFLDSAAYYFDIPVFRDYYLFTNLFNCIDNIGKNVYFACYDVATDKKLTLAVWDLDCTQGQYYDNWGGSYHPACVGPQRSLRAHELESHKVLHRLDELDPTFHGLATERYWELRNTTFHPDSIIARFKTYFNEMKICGADKREIARWSYGNDLGGHELNFTEETQYLRYWWTYHIAFLDNTIFAPYPMGDLDFDRDVSINDVTLLIDYLLGNWSTTINTVRADVNQDHKIDITDVTEVIDKILQD